MAGQARTSPASCRSRSAAATSVPTRRSGRTIAERSELEAADLVGRVAHLLAEELEADVARRLEVVDGHDVRAGDEVHGAGDVLEIVLAVVVDDRRAVDEEHRAVVRRELELVVRLGAHDE